MAEFLVIRLGTGSDDSVSWIAADDRGTRRGTARSGTLAEAAADVRERAVIVLVPACEAPTFSVDIPAKGSRLLAALPFALEDQLADDVENLHFAPGKRGASGSLPVAVVANERLAAWIEMLDDAGIHPQKIIPEHHGLAVTPNTWSMLIDEEQVFFNDGADLNFAIAGMAPGEALAAAGLIDEGETDGTGHLLVYCDAAVGGQYEKDWALLRHDLASVDVNHLPDGILPRLAVTVASGHGINLLQGRYGPKAEVAQLLAPWKYAAVFLVALGVVMLIGKGADYYRLSTEHAALKEQFAAEYREIQPNAAREIVDPAGAVNSLRRSIGGTSSATPVFLPSLLQLADALRANNAAEVETVTYRAGVINVRLSAPDIPTLDRIVQAVATSGRFSATLQSADSVGDRVNSRIEIREVGS